MVAMGSVNVRLTSLCNFNFDRSILPQLSIKALFFYPLLTLFHLKVWSGAHMYTPVLFVFLSAAAEVQSACS